MTKKTQKTNTAKRLWRHLCFFSWHGKRYCPPELLNNLANLVTTGEQTHLAEVKLIIEGDWHISEVLSGLTPHQRAQQVFSEWRVWDTENNSGVLIYLCLAERHIDIIADRGLKQVPPQAWQDICDHVTQAFSEQHYEQGLTQAILELNKVLAQYYPRREPKIANPSQDLPDMPVLM